MCLSLVSCESFVNWKDEMTIIEEMDMKHVGFIGDDRIVVDYKGEYYTYRHVINDSGTYKFLIYVHIDTPEWSTFSHRPAHAPDLTRLIRE